MAPYIKTGVGLETKAVPSSSDVCLVARRRSWTGEPLKHFRHVCCPAVSQGTFPAELSISGSVLGKFVQEGSFFKESGEEEAEGRPYCSLQLSERRWL